MWLIIVLLALSYTGDLAAFPLALDHYQDTDLSLLARLQQRISAAPLNLWVSLIFLCAILHTFFSKHFMLISVRIRNAGYRRIVAQRQGGTEPHSNNIRLRTGDTLPANILQRRRRFDAEKNNDPWHPSNFRKTDIPFWSEFFHLLGEVEAVFGIWVLALLVVLGLNIGWHDTVTYLTEGVSYVEPIFVVVIMTIASTKPILFFSEKIMRFVAGIFGDSPLSFWFTVLTVGPLLGSFITEPAAMTICALLLARYFYACKPSPALAYATLGLLFVNISVGGTFTTFAAPPVLMVAKTWQWDTLFMATNFGWKALVGILIANTVGALVFWRQFKQLREQRDPDAAAADESIPTWIICVHILFMLWTVSNSHYPPLFVGTFLFFFAFYQATRAHQQPLNVKNPLLVGFFLGGLVVHGGLQGWWIAPVLEGLSQVPLFCGAVILTAFNDNAAITYLATLVPDLAPQLKYAVVAGAVAGGGLTVIANAPNPAGQSLLNDYFDNGISPFGLLLGALPPTIVIAAVFLLL